MQLQKAPFQSRKEQKLLNFKGTGFDLRRWSPSDSADHQIYSGFDRNRKPMELGNNIDHQREQKEVVRQDSPHNRIDIDFVRANDLDRVSKRHRCRQQSGFNSDRPEGGAASFADDACPGDLTDDPS
jgi:hypothetical protein